MRTALAGLNEKEAAVRSLLTDAETARASLARARDEKASYIDQLSAQQRLNSQDIASLSRRAAVAEQRSAELQAAARAQAPSVQPAAAATSSQTSTRPPASLSAASGSQRTLTVDAVAYSLPGHTASGLPVGKGIVAVDPTVIPLGTRLYVPGYGPAIAADVGTAIKGAIIDLWFPTYDQAAAWGRKTVTITIYG